MLTSMLEGLPWKAAAEHAMPCSVGTAVALNAASADFSGVFLVKSPATFDTAPHYFIYSMPEVINDHRTDTNFIHVGQVKLQKRGSPVAKRPKPNGFMTTREMVPKTPRGCALPSVIAPALISEQAHGAMKNTHTQEDPTKHSA